MVAADGETSRRRRTGTRGDRAGETNADASGTRGRECSRAVAVGRNMENAMNNRSRRG